MGLRPIALAELDCASKTALPVRAERCLIEQAAIIDA